MTRRNNTFEEHILSPAVQEALTRLRSVPKPDPHTWDQARHAFLAQAGEDLGQSAAFSSEAGRTASETDHEDREAGLRAFLLPLWERRPTSMLARVLIALGIVLGSTLGTVQAAQSSLPGSALYPVKLRVEDLRMAGTQDPRHRIERFLEVAEECLEKAEQLTERGESVPAWLGELYAGQLGLALEELDRLTGPVRSEIRAEMAEELAEHLEEIRALQQIVGEGDPGLVIMISAIDDAALLFGGLDGALDDEDEGIGDDAEDGELDEDDDESVEEEDDDELEDEDDEIEEEDDAEGGLDDSGATDDNESIDDEDSDEALDEDDDSEPDGDGDDESSQDDTDDDSSYDDSSEYDESDEPDDSDDSDESDESEESDEEEEEEDDD